MRGSAEFPCVLIFSPLAGHGHLDSWNDLFVTLLLSAGWRVVVLSPDADQLRVRLADRSLQGRERLLILNWPDIRPGFWTRVGHRLRRAFVPHADHAVPAVHDPEAGYLEPEEFALRVRRALALSGCEPDIVFNMYMDLYRTDRDRWSVFEASHPLPWVGIRFVPGSRPVEAYYPLASLRGMCFLDEAHCANYARALPTKMFATLPDVTDDTVPDHPGPLACEIRQRAAGRTVVFMGGTIGASKNLSRWAELIALASPRDWFFVQLGEVNTGALPPEDREALARLESDTPEHLLMHRHYVATERDFNDAIRASDIIFAVYRRFTISSNMPGKAAALEKPILVAQGHLMGQRVVHYGIGRTVSESDTTDMLRALSELVENPVPPEKFAAYRSDFSQEKMQATLNTFLMSVHRSLGPGN